MADIRPRDAIQLFEAQAIATFTMHALQRSGALGPQHVSAALEARVDSLVWQVFVGSALGVLSADFVNSIASSTLTRPALTLSSTIYGLDRNDDALRLFFEFVSLEAELTEPELREFVRALDTEGMTFEVNVTTYFDGRDWPNYTPDLIQEVLAGSDKVDADTGAACLEVMTQLLVFEEDILAFEQAVGHLPSTAGIAKDRFAAVHRAAAAITQQRGSPEPRAMAHA